MPGDDKEEHARILRCIGEVLRADLKGLADHPPPRPVLLHVLHLIRREQERRTGDAMSWEELPDDLRQLLQRLKAGEGPTEL
jgi:hypothetical protein